MRRITTIALAALAAGCSLLSDVDDLKFGPADGGDSDADSDTDVDSDTDTDTDSDTDSDTDDPIGTCDVPYSIDIVPYSASHSTAGQPDAFVNLCESGCCAGTGENVYLFAPPAATDYTVEVWPSGSTGATAAIGVMEQACEDGAWCVAGGTVTDSYSTAQFYGSWESLYYIVVDGLDAETSYDITLYESAVFEDGTCEYPYNIEMLPYDGYGDTQMQADTFGSICGSTCCPGGDAVFAFTAPADGNYMITLTNTSSVAGGGGFAVSVLSACLDEISCLADASGAPASGDSFQLEFEAGEFMTLYIVVQGMTADGGGTFTLNVEAGTTTFDGGMETDG